MTRRFFYISALMGACWIWMLSGCTDSAPTRADDDISYRAGDMLIEGFRNESITTGTIKNILVAEKGYVFSQSDQMELYNLRLSILEPIPNAADDELQFRVGSVLTATTGSYYTNDRDFGDGYGRHKGDLDLFASPANPVVYDSPDMRLQADRLYYNTMNNSISTSTSYVLYDHKLNGASSSQKGFTLRFLPDGGRKTIIWGDEIKFKYVRKSDFDTSGVYLGPDPREIPQSRGADD